MMNTTNVLNWLNQFAALVEENKAYLSDLDTPIGDGDHGNNMSRGVKGMQAEFSNKTFESVADIFKSVAMALMGNIGGASGPLYGSAFMEMAKSAKESTDLAVIIRAGLDGMSKRGKAQRGEKTMVDVWEPVSDALAVGQLTKQVIDNAVLSTKDMLATKGRASYLGERSVGHLDPGSVSSGYLFTSMLDNLQ